RFNSLPSVYSSTESATSPFRDRIYFGACATCCAGARRTHLNPQKSVAKQASVFPVRCPWRNVTRHASAGALQLPPRITRFTSFSGLGGPLGSTVGLSL